MTKLTIHCEVETPDGEHEPVIEAIHLFERMPTTTLDAIVEQALFAADRLPTPIAALLAIGVCIAYGKNTITSRPN